MMMMMIPFACLVWVQSSKYQEMRAKIQIWSLCKIFPKKSSCSGCKFVLFLDVSIKQNLAFKKKSIRNLLYMEFLPIL